MDTPAPRPAAESRVEMTELAMPTDANILGTVFGGRIMQWVDLAGAMAARRHARVPVVTASIDELSFLVPVKVGDVVVLQARVNAAFGSSMEVEVTVYDEDPDTGVRTRCCDAFLTFVALGKGRVRSRVPPLLAGTEEERRREQAAHQRRAHRLAARKQN
jgi:acyl-CoA hydrolase